MSIVERPQTQLAEDWMILVFLAGIVMIAWLRWKLPGSIALLIRAFTNTRISRQVMREETLFARQNTLLNALFYLGAGMLLYLLSKFAGKSILNLTGIILFFAALVLPFIVYSVKSTIIRLVQAVCDGDFSLEEYRKNIFLVNRVAGLFLLPLTIVAAYIELQYVEMILWAGAFILVLAWIYRLARGVLNAAAHRVPLFYILFYICAFEILPVLISYRIYNLN